MPIAPTPVMWATWAPRLYVDGVTPPRHHPTHVATHVTPPRCNPQNNQPIRSNPNPLLQVPSERPKVNMPNILSPGNANHKSIPRRSQRRTHPSIPPRPQSDAKSPASGIDILGDPANGIPRYGGCNVNSAWFYAAASTAGHFFVGDFADPSRRFCRYLALVKTTRGGTWLPSYPGIIAASEEGALVKVVVDLQEVGLRRE